MSDAVHVYVDLLNVTHYVGRLWSHSRGGRQAATFEYDDEWLGNSDRFPLEPALLLGEGAYHTDGGKALFGSLGDSAPDRWGRMLMRRAARREAEIAGTTPGTLLEIDYLLRVHDETRQGALRFATERGGPFLAEDGGAPIPPLVELPRLLAAVEHVGADDATDEDLRLLLAPGSSLGGARPKASVRDVDGSLAIAKFPQKDDDYDTVAWEAVALNLAEKAGISVTERRLEKIAGKSVLILKRFDREGDMRIPFLSAMSAIGGKDQEVRSYLEIADAISMQGARPSADLAELWRRMVFTVLISNTDDHMRNQGFLYEGTSGWVLSPAYDINPTPADIRPRVLSSCINEADQRASLDLVFEVAEYFRLKSDLAVSIVIEVGKVVARWKEEASSLGLSKSEINRMASAFEHEDLEKAKHCG
ncbi:MAG: type II toxin-antitoxin system HipA family toxin [Planctomycetota bacterium]|nr:type II toxin-antitoxin system HipA family toxin [Planctomycetota bacterium]MDA1143188.1 type II toxin-antitoxin system HipA family toxin [Planctomycetota bacterium]